MSIAAVKWAFRQEGLGLSERMVLVRLAEYADDDGGSIFPQQADVARECSLSRESVSRAVRGLQKRGLLTIIRGRTRNDYQINFGAQDVTHDHISDVTEDHNSIPDVTEDHSRCDGGSHLDVTEDHIPYKQPPLNPPLNHQKRESIPKPPDEVPQAVDEWNALAADTGLPKLAKLTAQRRKLFRARLEDCGGMDGWRHAMARIRGSPFLLGENDRGWKAGIDFVLRESSFAKLMEGTYDGNRTVSKPEKSAARAASDAAMARVFGGDEPGDDGAEPAAGGWPGNGGGPHFGAFRVVTPSEPEGGGGGAEEAFQSLPHAADGRDRT